MKRLDDETKAGLLTLGWAIGLATGAMVNGATGAIIAIFSTLIFIGVLYSSWLIERVEKRLGVYVDAAGKAITKAQQKKIKP